MSAPNLLKQLEAARRELLELSSQNRLLNTPREQATGCSLEIKDESAEQVFQWLVTETKEMRFEQGEELAAPVGEDGEKAPQKRVTTKRARTAKSKTKAVADAEVTDAEVVPAAEEVVPAKPSVARSNPSLAEDPDRQSDDTLHTELDPDELDRRLLALVTDSTASFEEQGVNILYLVLGFLRWTEADKPDDPRDAPLLLIPVRLSRAHAGNRFSLTYTGDEIETNLTLKTRLKIDYGIDLPVVPQVEDLSPAVYFQEVQRAIAGRRGWEVRRDDCMLWFFSFTKLLMYRELAPETWPPGIKLEDQPLIRALLGDGFPAAAPLVADDARIDALLDPANTMHVIDCDSSQSLVIEEVCRGRSLVIQGPPGTGKSQTITNLVAAAVRSGKTILFIAEKMAALEVVKRRLDNIGLGDMCLELHSDKTNKRAVLEEIDRTLKLGRPREPPELRQVVERVKSLRDQLNQHADLMHAPLAPHGETPYRILTELIDLRCAKAALPDFQIADAPKWTGEQLQQRAEQVRDYCAAIGVLGSPQEHPWRGCTLTQIMPLDLERLLTTIPQGVSALDELRTAAESLGQKLGGNVPQSLDDVARLTRTLQAVLAAPKLDPQALEGLAWEDHRPAVHELAESGRAIVKSKEQLKGVIHDAAWQTDVSAARQAYATYGQSWFRMFRSSYRAARKTLNGALVGPQPGTFEERLAILELLYGWQQGQKHVAEADALGSKAFGRFWAGKQTDWTLVDKWEEWDTATAAGDPLPRFRGLCGLVQEPAALKAAGEQVEKLLTVFVEKLAGLLETLKIEREGAFSVGWAVPTKAAEPATPIGKLTPAAGGQSPPY